ncbi:unnamed protein product [Dovyalis caffra]|uniref:Transcriptional corepressor SEUSS n=1 Tax=Dovyalis caffra TaxID=77055 RepID=A0AAV1SMG6_9ROSI|nr:unnamed protein product [Dovyalis caffra]
MIPSRPQTPIGGSQSVSPVLLRSNSAILGSQGGGSMQLGQYNMNLVGNSPGVSSLINQSFGKGSSSSGLSGLESSPISMVANDVGFCSSFDGSNMVSSASSGKVQSKRIANPSGGHQPQIQQFEPHMLQHGQKQFQSIPGGLGAMGPVKLEPLVTNEHIGSQRRFQSLHSLGSVKLEPQQNQIGRGIGPVKMENQLSVQSALRQQQQQQQFLNMSRQSPQAAVAQMNYLQQQQILQLQQQQQILRAFPHQQPQMQQFQQQNSPVRSVARPPYEPGTGARRLTQYMYQQQHKPQDNNIEFWRKFVAEFFAPNARKRLCVSLYGNSRQTNGVFPQDLRHCEICNHKPGRGFETTVEVLPRLFKIKYDSGTLEELLYVDMPHEYHNASGQIVLDYAKAIQESVFEHLRVVRNGRLRIVFSPDLKICSWEFCACRHEELIPRRLITPQVSQLGAVAQKYQASAQNASLNSSSSDLESNCNMFLASARQLSKALEIPLVNDLGYTKRYVRCLQISEVVNCMKDLIDYTTQEAGKGPIESLAQFPRRTRPGVHNSDQQPPEKKQRQITGHTSNDDHYSVQASVMHPSSSSVAASANNSLGTSSTTSSSITVAGLFHQNSMNSRIENQMTSPGSPYTGTSVQIPSAGSSTTLPPAQPNPSSPFSCLTPSSSNNPPQSSHNTVAASTAINHVSSANSPVQTPMQQSSQSNEVDPNEFQSSVEKIIQEMMISSQFSGSGSMGSVDYEGNNMKDINKVTQSRQNMLTSGPCLEGNLMGNNKSSTVGGGFGNLNGQNRLSASTSGITTAMGNASGTLSGRFAMPVMNHDAGMNHQQQALAYQLLNGLGANLMFPGRSKENKEYTA